MDADVLPITRRQPMVTNVLRSVSQCMPFEFEDICRRQPSRLRRVVLLQSNRHDGNHRRVDRRGATVSSGISTDLRPLCARTIAVEVAKSGMQPPRTVSFSRFLTAVSRTRNRFLWSISPTSRSIRIDRAWHSTESTPSQLVATGRQEALPRRYDQLRSAACRTRLACLVQDRLGMGPRLDPCTQPEMRVLSPGVNDEGISGWCLRSGVAGFDSGPFRR